MRRNFGRQNRRRYCRERTFGGLSENGPTLLVYYLAVTVPGGPRGRRRPSAGERRIIFGIDAHFCYLLFLHVFTSSCPPGLFFRYSHFWLLYGFRIGSDRHPLQLLQVLSFFNCIFFRNCIFMYQDDTHKSRRVHNYVSILAFS